MSQRSRLQVLLGGIFEELILVFRRHDDSHALLRLGNSELRSVKTFIFFRDKVKVDLQAVGQFADRYGDTARAEVIALLDQAGNLGTAEEALEFALGGGIALLYFRAAGGQGFLGVGL